MSVLSLVLLASTSFAMTPAVKLDVDARKAMGVAIEGSRLYAVSGDDFFVFDVSRPLVSPFADGRKVSGIPRSDGWLVAFTCRMDREVALYDFKDRESPRPLGGWKVSGNPDLAAFRDGRLIVPCGRQGLLMSRKRYDLEH